METSQLSLREFHFKIIVCTQILLPFRLRGDEIFKAIKLLYPICCGIFQWWSHVSRLNPNCSLSLRYLLSYIGLLFLWYFIGQKMSQVSRQPKHQLNTWRSIWKKRSRFFCFMILFPAPHALLINHLPHCLLSNRLWGTNAEVVFRSLNWPLTTRSMATNVWLGIKS